MWASVNKMNRTQVKAKLSSPNQDKTKKFANNPAKLTKVSWAFNSLVCLLFFVYLYLTGVFGGHVRDVVLPGLVLRDGRPRGSPADTHEAPEDRRQAQTQLKKKVYISNTNSTISGDLMMNVYSNWLQF